MQTQQQQQQQQPRILITSASGKLGSSILETLGARTDVFQDVIGTSRYSLSENILGCDANDYEQVKRCLEKIMPEIIVLIPGEDVGMVREKQGQWVGMGGATSTSGTGTGEERSSTREHQGGVGGFLRSLVHGGREERVEQLPQSELSERHKQEYYPVSGHKTLAGSKTMMGQNWIRAISELEGSGTGTSGGGIRHTILVSHIGAETATQPLLNEFGSLEFTALDKLRNVTIIRPSFLQENFEWFSDFIRYDHVLPLSIGQGSFAPLSVWDLGKFIRRLCLEPRTLHLRFNRQVFTLTGPKLYNGFALADTLNEFFKHMAMTPAQKRLVEYRELPREEMREVLMKVTKGNSLVTERCLEVFDEVKRGKMGFVGLDYFRVVGEDPRDITLYFAKNPQLFAEKRY